VSVQCLELVNETVAKQVEPEATLVESGLKPARQGANFVN
jgi:hypothetical protein